MTRKRNRIRIGRNEACPCGSGSKFKVCHGRDLDAQPMAPEPQYIDSGEEPIRWVIVSDTGTAFFADVANRIIVFPTREMATEISKLEMFADREPGEINVAGVGPTKWVHLQETLPFLEVASVAQAMALIDERINSQKAELGLTDAHPNSEEVSHVQGQEQEASQAGGQESSQESGDTNEAVQG